jgi:hypothetical protein
MSWPYPGDSPVARARRVAHAYRARLQTADPPACADLDATMRAWGQQWAVPRVLTVEPDAWVTASEAADLAAVSLGALRELRRRQRLTGRKVDGRWQYQVKEIVALGARKRARTGTGGT